jgi:outer membrane protein OmpA-like peptidoglycan-associated protein
MSSKVVVALGALLVSASASAQAGPVAEKSSDEIVCQLTGDCGAVDPSLATQDKEESRGFSIAKRGTSTPSTSASRTTAGTPSRTPAARVAGSTTQRFSIAKPATIGRSDLMINFVSGSSALTESGKRQAQAFYRATQAPQLAGKRFLIGGHTDASGSRALNLDLSQRRAQAVVDYLAEQGAERARFDVKGYGFDKPLKGTSPRAAANRRVEVVKLD